MEEKFNEDEDGIEKKTTETIVTLVFHLFIVFLIENAFDCKKDKGSFVVQFYFFQFKLPFPSFLIRLFTILVVIESILQSNQTQIVLKDVC